MNTNEFDDLIKAKVEQTELAYNPANWDKLTRELHPAPAIQVGKTGFIRYMGIAASLLLVVAAFAWIFTRNNKDESIAKAPVPATTTPSKVHHQKSVAVPPVTEEESENVTPASTVAAAPVERKKATHRTILQTPAPIAVQSPAVAQTQPAEPVVNEELPIVKNRTPDKAAPANPFSFNESFQPKPVIIAGGKTHVSITGGMNYGSLNTGYMAGINARQKIGGKMYVEGDLTLVSNQVTESTVSPNQWAAFESGLGAKSSESNVVTQTPSNFLYIQFNPSVGYQVHKKVSLSLGADLQRLVDHNDNLKTLVYQSDELKLIPGLDMGLTGKTEYAVTKKLKAGVLYREGINNLINGGEEYLDRRYLQVQLKFTVFGK